MINNTYLIWRGKMLTNNMFIKWMKNRSKDKKYFEFYKSFTTYFIIFYKSRWCIYRLLCNFWDEIKLITDKSVLQFTVVHRSSLFQNRWEQRNGEWWKWMKKSGKNEQLRHSENREVPKPLKLEYDWLPNHIPTSYLPLSVANHVHKQKHSTAYCLLLYCF